MTEKLQGNIKRIFFDKGFGFIECENGDIFFHATDLAFPEEERFDRFKELQEGQAVEFTEGEGRNGKPKAEDIEII